MMVDRRLTSWVPVLVSCICLVAWRPLPLPAASPIAGESATGVLVLRNGNCLRGEIDHRDGYFHVQSPGGSVVVPARQVDFFSTTLDEAYIRLRERVSDTSTDEHIELARWCLQHRLLEHAEAELTHVRKLDSSHRELNLLERRLKVLRRPHDAPRELETEVPTVSHQQHDTMEQQGAASAAVVSVSQQSRAMFVRNVQPLLVHSCTTSGCHHSGGREQFQLDRLATVGVGHPDLIERNLAAALDQVDFDDAEHSPVLRKALRVHGEHGNLSERVSKRQWQTLQRWVKQIAAERNRAEVVEPLPTASSTQQPAIVPDATVLPAGFIEWIPAEKVDSGCCQPGLSSDEQPHTAESTTAQDQQAPAPPAK